MEINYTNQSYNFFICDKPEVLPFPEESKPLIQNINWSEYLFNSSGFPENGATYSLLDGKTLYKEAKANGDTQISKEDFSGEVLLGSYFVSPDKEEGSNFFLTFKAIFLKGDLIETSLKDCRKQPTKDYDSVVQKYLKNFDKITKRENSWWYKYLYFPYRFCLRMVAMGTIWVLLFLKEWITKITLFLTPY
jgi:hypothetical protein